jgi:hypothetical protein
MPLVHRNSLVATLDVLNEALFFDRPLSTAQRDQASQWIAGRVGQPGSYRGMPAPTAEDFTISAQVFTGEWVRSGAGLGHVLGEEACRALLLLKSRAPEVKAALKSASAQMIEGLAHAEARGDPAGLYCCRRCSVALWRHLAVGGLRHAERRLASGIRMLKASRGENNRWNTFPFYYTVLALNDIGLPTARTELRFAAPALERAVRRPATGDMHDVRRRALIERVLAKV